MHDLNKPDGLSPVGEKAYNCIMNLLTKNNTLSTGGCRAFYSPEEWKARGEEYGGGAELIVVHDGGDLMEYFCMDVMDYAAIDCMSNALGSVGCYPEQCTSWYSAIYKS